MVFVHHAKAPFCGVPFCVAEADENHARRKSRKKRGEKQPRVDRARAKPDELISRQEYATVSLYLNK